ncbi:MAG: hypothetical protein M1282_12550 [Chloroflexi bacterium]|nr:hypothetical protein [Chloroflexota bacterium]
MLKRVLPFLPLLVILVFTACSSVSPQQGGISPEEVTAVIQTMTAALWTPTPSLTPEPDSRTITDLLNGVMIGSDPLSETIEAKFNVLDVRFPIEPNSKKVVTMQMDVECEWIFTDNCTPEETFVHLMKGFDPKSKLIDKISAQVPPTVKIVEVTTFNHRVQNGKIIVNWQDMVDFATGKINGNQLGSRIVRLTH